MPERDDQLPTLPLRERIALRTLGGLIALFLILILQWWPVLSAGIARLF